MIYASIPPLCPQGDAPQKHLRVLVDGRRTRILGEGLVKPPSAPYEPHKPRGRGRPIDSYSSGEDEED